MSRTLRRRLVITAGMVIALWGLTGLFAYNSIVNNRLAMQFVSYIDQLGLLELKHSADLTGGRDGMVSVSTSEGHATLWFDPSVARRLEQSEHPDPYYRTESMQTSGGLWVWVYGTPEFRQRVARFDHRTASVSTGTVRRVLAYEAAAGYRWSLAYATHHNPLWIPPNFLAMVGRLAVLPLLLFPPFRWLFAPVITILGLVILVRSLGEVPAYLPPPPSVQ